MGAEDRGAGLMPGALHGNTMNVRTQCGIILLSLDEWLHMDGRNQANIVAAASSLPALCRKGKK